MRNYICIIFLSTFFYSCVQKNKIPPGIINPAKMQAVLWDVLRADMLAQEIVKKDSLKTIKTESGILDEKIFILHKISRSEFDNSLSFYQKHPDLMKTIFDSINAKQTRKASKQFHLKKPY